MRVRGCEGEGEGRVIGCRCWCMGVWVCGCVGGRVSGCERV